MAVQSHIREGKREMPGLSDLSQFFPDLLLVQSVWKPLTWELGAIKLSRVVRISVPPAQNEIWTQLNPDLPI